LVDANYCSPIDEFIKGFQVFDKAGNGFIGAGELRYVLTQLGEKMTDDEVDELLKGFPVQYVLCSYGCGVWSPAHAPRDGQINYHSFVRSILAQ
jgi:calmodulin